MKAECGDKVCADKVCKTDKSDCKPDKKAHKKDGCCKDKQVKKMKYFQGTKCPHTGMNVYDPIGKGEVVKPRHDV